MYASFPLRPHRYQSHATRRRHLQHQAFPALCRRDARNIIAAVTFAGWGAVDEIWLDGCLSQAHRRLGFLHRRRDAR